MSSRALVACAVLVACLSPGLAAAQTIPIAPQFSGGGGSDVRGGDPQRMQMPLRSPITLVPSITMSEEFNDNIFLNNRNRQWDFITGMTPALNFIWESRVHRLIAGYNFTAEWYARDETQNNAFNRQNFGVEGTYRLTEQLTLSMSDGFTASNDTNLIAPEGVSSGRSRSWSNGLGVGATYRFDELTSVRGGASWAVQRYAHSELDDSDTYRADATVQRRLSRQVQATGGYEFAYFDIQHEGTVTTHTPRVGAIWQATPLVRLSLSAGPTFEERDNGDSRITPAVTADYGQQVSFGNIGLGFNRQVATAGGFGGTTDNTSVTGRIEVNRLARGLSLSFLPRYSWVKSGTGNQIDITSFTIPLQATYRLTAWMAAVASYQFYQQRSNSQVRDNRGNLLATDADQNRLLIGLQFGYPITFDRP